MSSSTSTSETPDAGATGTDSRDGRAYARFFVLFVLVYAGVAAFNVVVDPFAIFGTGIECFVRHRDDVTVNRATIFAEASRASPRTLVIGTSRVRRLSPDAMTKMLGEPVYVLPVVAGSIYELRRHFEYFATRMPLRRVVLGLDFYSFNPDRVPSAGFEEARLSDGLYLRDHVIAATSTKALMASLKIVGECTFAAEPEPAEEAPHRLDPAEIVAWGLHPDYYNTSAFEEQGAFDEGMEHLAALVEVARENDIEVHAYISPIYIDQQLMIHAVGRGDSFAEWKRQLAPIVAPMDFNDHNSITVDPERFDDPAHFDSPTGEILMARLLGLPAPGAPGDFGVRLTPEAVESILSDQASRLDPSEIERMGALLPPAAD